MVYIGCTFQEPMSSLTLIMEFITPDHILTWWVVTLSGLS